MSSGLAEDQKLLYRPVNEEHSEPQVVSNVSSSTSIIVICALCGAVAIWFYLKGRYIVQDYQEKSYRRDVRRRHGIPDDDTRPFEIAVKDAETRMAQEEADLERKEALKPRQKAVPRPSSTSKENGNMWPDSDQATPRPLKRFAFQDGYSSTHTPTFNKSTNQSLRIAKPDVQNEYIGAHNPVPPGALPLPDPFALAWYSSSTEEPGVSNQTRKGVKRSVSNVDDSNVAPARKRHAKGTEADPSSVEGSNPELEEDVDDAEMESQSAGEDSHAESEDASEHSLRGTKRHRDSETNTEVGGYKTGKRQHQKRRLDERRPASLVLRGKKRDRSDQGSVMGDGVPVRSRKREKLYDQLGDVEMLEDIRESDMDEDEESGPPESQLSSPTDNLTDELPFSTDPLCQGRRIGEEWTASRQRFKVGYDGRRLRHALVKRIRRKYIMPEDSVHPDAIQQVQVLVETWLTEEEYKEARDRQELAWQDGSLAGKVAFPASPSVSGFSEKDLSIPIRTPGISPLKREFTPRVIPNPFLEPPKPITGRRIAYSTSSNSNRPPTLMHMRNLSELDREELEAAAMARLRAAKQDKLVTEKAAQELEAAKDNKKLEVSGATNTASATASVGTVTAGKTTIPPSAPALTTTPAAEPSGNNFSSGSITKESQSVPMAEKSNTLTNGVAAPMKPPVPLFNFTAPTPKVTAPQEILLPKGSDKPPGKDPLKTSYSFGSTPQSLSFNFSSPASTEKKEDAAANPGRPQIPKPNSKLSFTFGPTPAPTPPAIPSSTSSKPQAPDNPVELITNTFPSFPSTKAAALSFNFSATPAATQNPFGGVNDKKDGTPTAIQNPFATATNKKDNASPSLSTPLFSPRQAAPQANPTTTSNVSSSSKSQQPQPTFSNPFGGSPQVGSSGSPAGIFSSTSTNTPFSFSFGNPATNKSSKPNSESTKSS